jgi:cytochrome c biogenesis protein CcdA/thiol-disulfide isomerase/thioredoxin
MPVLLFLLAYLGGALTILSPCILPVLPFVFARAEKGFVRSSLPLLVGMAATFVLVATLAAIGGGWAVRANTYGRFAALAIMALFGVTLLFPALADRLTRPLVALGSRLTESADGAARTGSSIGPSFLLGIATGLLWAPCAGPILGIILTGAALEGASARTSLLLGAYAAGAATSLALALLVGGRVFTAMKHSLGAGEWVRRGLGAAVLVGVAAIALGFDTGLLSKLSFANTSRIEQALIDKAPMTKASDAGPMNDATLASLTGATAWINSPPLTARSLRGKVVLIDFWTYSCINCLRSLPYVSAWADKYKDQGLVVIGVHAPEFAFEKNVDNVRKATADLHIHYPVAIDNNYVIWRAFNNRYWPAHYFIDATGRIRAHQFGEGDYSGSEKIIQTLLAEAGRKGVANDVVSITGQGAEAASDAATVMSPETYLGYARARNFASPGGAVRDVPHTYSAPSSPQLNQWGLQGDWTLEGQTALSNTPGGQISYRFHSRDLHLVLGPDASGQPVRFRISIDGRAPGADHGTDVDDQGLGTVTDHRLYQLVRQKGPVADHTFEIEFLDPGVQAFAFTFG